MAKQSGLGDQLFFAGVDIGADVASISSLSTPRDTLPATGITQSGMARMFGKRDGSAEFVTYFNKASGETFQTLKALPTTDVHLMYCRGQGIGSEAIGLVGKQVDHSAARGEDGSLLFTVPVQANAYGIDWCDQLTAGKVTHASAGSTTGLDMGAAGAFGWQAYLQVFSLGSGTATVTIQESSDNAVGDPYANVTGGAFTAITGATAERIQSASDTAATERYLRVTTTGTFTNLVFAVAINVNQAARAI